MFKKVSEKQQVSASNPPLTVFEDREEIEAELEQESADYFSSFAQMLGFPKSVGQIYGLLFMSVEPIPMESVMNKLGISKGSASQGLNVLKDVGAVQTMRISGDRRDHFEADFDVSRMIHHFLEEKLKPRIDHGEERLERMRAIIETLPEKSQSRAVAEGRLSGLRKWQSRGKGILPFIQKFFKR